MSNFGDIQQGDSVNAFFSTSSQAGAAATITSGSVVVFKDGTTSNSTSFAFQTASAFSFGINPISAIASHAWASISYHILNFVLGDHISTIFGRE